MRRSVLFLVIALATAAPAVGTAKPGPNGSNHHGMCTAYFAGSEQGRAQKRKAKPFVELERVSSEAYDAEHGENEASIDEKVRWWCDANDPKAASGTSAAPAKGNGKAKK